MKPSTFQLLSRLFYRALLLTSLLMIASWPVAAGDLDADSDLNLGHILGAVAGGAIGYQFGDDGREKAISTAAGAVLGSVVGDQIYNNWHPQSFYQSEYADPFSEFPEDDYYHNSAYPSYQIHISRPFAARPSHAPHTVHAQQHHFKHRFRPHRPRQHQAHHRLQHRHAHASVHDIGADDYMLKQKLSDERKRRNMIRNGEDDPLELPYDVSNVQTSWDDPDN